MNTIKKIEFDTEKSSTSGIEYRIVFTDGLFEDPSGMRFPVESSVFRIKKSDYKDITVPIGYHFYYNPRNQTFSLLDANEFINLSECNDYGEHIGGFLIMKYQNKCKLSFVYPKCENGTKSIRPFSDDFDTYDPDNQEEGSFEGREIPCDPNFAGELCNAFNTLNFDNSYEIKCPITENVATNSFDYCEYDDSDFETEPKPGCSI